MCHTLTVQFLTATIDCWGFFTILRFESITVRVLVGHPFFTMVNSFFFLPSCRAAFKHVSQQIFLSNTSTNALTLVNPDIPNCSPNKRSASASASCVKGSYDCICARHSVKVFPEPCSERDTNILCFCPILHIIILSFIPGLYTFPKA